MQIDDKIVPTGMFNDSTHRKAPSPPTATETETVLRVRSTTSQDTLHQNEKEILKGELEKYHIDRPRESEMTSFEVHALRSKVELLELKLEEMTQKVHMLQWHSDPQRQAALEDWALERMIAIYNQHFPQPKATIGELVRLFEVSKQKSCLTSIEFRYLRSLLRIRDHDVQNFLVTPSWFSQNVERDIKEIATYVVKQQNSESRKRNWRLYQYATGRSPKADAKSSLKVFI